jgi:hypothetical protein
MEPIGSVLSFVRRHCEFEQLGWLGDGEASRNTHAQYRRSDIDRLEYLSGSVRGVKALLLSGLDSSHPP